MDVERVWRTELDELSKVIVSEPVTHFDFQDSVVGIRAYTVEIPRPTMATGMIKREKEPDML